MWTMPKLIAGVLFAALGWYVSALIAPHFEEIFEGRNVGRMIEVSTFICFIIGWKVAGARAGLGYAAAISYGLTATIAMVVVSLFAQSFAEMIRKALNRDYGDSPMMALVNVFELMIDFSEAILKPDVLITLLVGGILAGLIVEWSGRRFI